jgi:hypothetical protein
MLVSQLQLQTPLPSPSIAGPAHQRPHLLLGGDVAQHVPHPLHVQVPRVVLALLDLHLGLNQGLDEAVIVGAHRALQQGNAALRR